MTNPDSIFTLIQQLMTGGIGVLALYLYFQERQAHKTSREQHIEDLKHLQEARIADYKLWLQMMSDIIANGAKRLPIQPPFSPPDNIPTPTPKSHQK